MEEGETEEEEKAGNEEVTEEKEEEEGAEREELPGLESVFASLVRQEIRNV